MRAAAVRSGALRVTACVLVVSACSAPKYSVEALENPATCAACHPRHYREWAGSMHARASDDPVFVAMNNRGVRDTSGLLGTFCTQCHAPMAVALSEIDGGPFDPAMLSPATRGVTCYFCHNVDHVVGAQNNGLKLAFDDTMRGGVEGPVNSPAHRSAFDATLMATPRNGSTMCGSCHDVVTQRGVALERTFREWTTSMFAPSSMTGESTTCTACHMTASVDPPVTLIAEGEGFDAKARVGAYHEHLWPGVDVGSDAIVVTGLTSPGAPQRGGICVTADGHLTVRLDTIGVGHSWPTGAAHNRRVWLEVIAYDAGGSVVFSSGVIGDGEDPDAVPDVVGLWDRTATNDGSPAHFFWDVATVQSQALTPPVTSDPTDPRFDHGRTTSFALNASVAQAIDRITTRLRARPFSYAALNGLVASGDLDPTYAASIPTFDAPGTVREWSRTDIDPSSDGCNRGD